MSESIHIDKKQTKCPLGFSSWFGKKPDFVKNQQTDAVKLNDEIKTTIQCQNQNYFGSIFGDSKDYDPIPAEKAKIVIPERKLEVQQSEFEKKYGDLFDRYNELPRQLTQFKNKFIFKNQGTNERLITLMLVTLGSAGLSRFGKIFILVNKGPLTMFRNVVIGYYTWGLFIAPEIYNPNINQK